MVKHGDIFETLTFKTLALVCGPLDSDVLEPALHGVLPHPLRLAGLLQPGDHVVGRVDQHGVELGDREHLDDEGRAVRAGGGERIELAVEEVLQQVPVPVGLLQPPGLEGPHLLDVPVGPLAPDRVPEPGGRPAVPEDAGVPAMHYVEVSKRRVPPAFDQINI